MSIRTAVATLVLALAAARAGADEDVERRRRACLERLASAGGIAGQIARLETARATIDEAPIREALDFVDARRDTADFRMAELLRLVYLFGEDPRVPRDLAARLEGSIRRFRYRVDEPGTDDMIFWSENHAILFSSAEHLAGQLDPAHGERATRGKERVLVWLDRRWRFGFSEWCSPVYLAFSIGALLNLVDFSGDAEVVRRAEMVLDLAIYDLARLTHRGNFGVASGRAYGRNKVSASGQSIGSVLEILFGARGEPVADYAAIFLATSRRYRAPEVLLAIGRSVPERAVDRSRHGLSFAEGPAHGIGFDDLEDGLYWWEGGAIFAPPVAALSRRMIDAWGLWDTSYFRRLEAFRDAIPLASRLLAPFSEGPVLGAARLYVFRTPVAMLSSVQDHRPGGLSFQIHPWQATLGHDAVVWTTMPGRLRDGLAPEGLDVGLDAWTGSLALPRILQHEDVALVLYEPPAPLARLALEGGGTHAWFPRAAFDEVETGERWTFARKGDGYVALHSARPARWAGDSEWAAEGDWNAFVCEVGRRAEDGPFADFVRRVRDTPRSIRRGRIRYGDLEMTWTGDLGVAHDFRYDGAHARCRLGEDRLVIEHAGERLVHVWSEARRE